MIHLSRQGVVFSGSEADLNDLRRSFERNHYILLKDFLDSNLAALIQPFVERAEYRPATYKNVGSELLMEGNRALDILSFLANDLTLFRLIQAITGCGHIGSFLGRVYRLIPDPQHNFDWHNDLGDTGRLVALSINLGTEVYRGGVLQIREADSQRITGEVINTGFGNAVLFQISQELEHRVTPIEGEVFRTSFAGWFKSRPEFRTQLATAR